jgi:hypothetical protein
MVRLGFTLVNLKGMYLDGHERADVVKFRRQFVSAMAVYEKFMENYETKKDGDGNVISHTTVAAEDCRKKIVWVTHDESCAKANDSNNHAYLFHQDPRRASPRCQRTRAPATWFLASYVPAMDSCKSRRSRWTTTINRSTS